MHATADDDSAADGSDGLRGGGDFGGWDQRVTGEPRFYRSTPAGGAGVGGAGIDAGVEVGRDVRFDDPLEAKKMPP